MKWLKTFKNKIVNVIEKIFNYQINDPTTPEFVIKMEIPELPKPCPPFLVKGFTGQPAEAGTLQHQASNVYITIASSLNYVQKTLTNPIMNWPALCRLTVNPRAGKMFNAYYDRHFLNFFYDFDPITSQTIYTCDSTDVVSHELGHAILDSIRPDLWAIQSVEIQAFHEAFGDINAMLTAMIFPDITNKILQQTGGDLKKPNSVTRLAEQMGLAIFHAKGGKEIPENFCLRSAINDFQYQIPESLPTKAPENVISGEPHSFSRIFTAAWYDSFVRIYEKEKQSMSLEDAIITAKDKISKITLNGVRHAPITARFYSSVLKAMLAYDDKFKLGCGEFIEAGFAAHNISTNCCLPKMNLDRHIDCDPFCNYNRNERVETTRLSDFIDCETPGKECLVEMPKTADMSHKYMIDPDEVLDLQEAIRAAHYSLKIINEANKIGHGPSSHIHDKEFTIIDGKLIRNYYACWHKSIVV